MTSFVTDSLVNPVLRRFSFTRSSISSSATDSASSLPRRPTFLHSQQADVISAISEIEEDSPIDDDSEDSAPSHFSTRIPSLRISHEDIEDRTSSDGIMIPADTATSGADARGSGSPSNALFPAHRITSTSETPSSPSAGSAVQDPRQLPEDDGMSLLRKRILAIQALEIGHSEKARLMHELLMEGYTNSRSHLEPDRSILSSSPKSPEKQALPGNGPSEPFRQGVLNEAETAESFNLTEEDLEPSFVPKRRPSESHAITADSEPDDEQLLGCEHYRRNVKLQCFTCKRWYPCRFCHDKVEDHSLIRKETRNMLCMFCGTAQKAGQTCVSCEAQAARYYCDICKLWNDDPDKPCYHCNDCGICRIGHGIGKDFYHCKKCCACITIASQSDHKCIERVIDCNCPICGDYMFTSPKSVCFMKCGHSIHRDCFEEHQKSSYKCPLCNKSLVNMESQFRNLELSIQAQPMPSELRDARALVLCHDCTAKSTTSYHWLGMKCGVCQSYNTAQLQIIGVDAQASALTSATPHPIRDTRRRHSSVTGPAFMDPNLSAFVPDRLARSASPVQPLGRPLPSAMRGGYFNLEEEQDEGDIFGFWRSTTTNDEDDEDGEYSSDDDLTLDEEIDDGEESEGDDFELLGHR